MNKPLVIFVYAREGNAKSTRYGGFSERLKQAGGFPDCDVLNVALENLAFVITSVGEASVFDTVSGLALDRASFVYIKSWESMVEEAAALSIFLTYKGVPYSDTLPMGMGTSKLATSFRLWGQGVSVPLSIYVRRADRLAKYLADFKAENLGEKIIVKDIKGQKGNHNYLVVVEDAVKIIKENPDIRFMCQRYIPNSGDFRVGVYFEQSSFVIKRIADGKSHLNNTSAGGSAELIPLHEFPEELKSFAEAAARAARLQVAGVDIIVDKITYIPYILEVNQGSQIVTGVYKEENKTAFNKALNRQLSRSKVPRSLAPLSIIGRRATIGIPNLGITAMVGKIDTGAYVSSIHAENIRLEDSKDCQELVFTIRPDAKTDTMGNITHEIRYKKFSRHVVKSSNGQEEERFSIKTPVIINGLRRDITLTLSDRSVMTYPLLIGRTVLYAHYLVDVERTEKTATALKNFYL